MIALMDSITDKPHWDRIIFDESTVQEWAQRRLGISETMFDWCIAELRDKTTSFRSTGIISSLDLNAVVVKSDSIIASDLKEALKVACAPLDNIPPRLKDWYPESGGIIRKLVDPSFYPLVYGRSRVLPSVHVGLQDCLSTAGKGTVTQELTKAESISNDNSMRLQWFPCAYDHSRWQWDACEKNHSRRFQWLPCNVAFVANEGVEITSYINNLHPLKYRAIYEVVEQCISKVIPLWDEMFSSMKDNRNPRIKYDHIDYYFPLPREPPENWVPEKGYNTPPPGADLTNHQRIERERAWLQQEKKSRELKIPEIDTYESIGQAEKSKVNLRTQFKEQGLQVIVELANIELTPEKPLYAGGMWNMNNQLKDKIRATALYYYDCENISDGSLNFRYPISLEIPRRLFHHLGCHQAGELFTHGYSESIYAESWSMADQEEHQVIEAIYPGMRLAGPMVQEIGKVKTKEGRMLAFPNVVQYCDTSFRLRDHSRPGHRKVLALYLVDPLSRILSTANVPPQQKSWWTDEVRQNDRISRLPTELVDMIFDHITEFSISQEEATENRLKLLEERRIFADVCEENGDDWRPYL